MRISFLRKRSNNQSLRCILRGSARDQALPKYKRDNKCQLRTLGSKKKKKCARHRWQSFTAAIILLFTNRWTAADAMSSQSQSNAARASRDLREVRRDTRAPESCDTIAARDWSGRLVSTLCCPRFDETQRGSRRVPVGRCTRGDFSESNPKNATVETKKNTRLGAKF